MYFKTTNDFTPLGGWSSYDIQVSNKSETFCYFNNGHSNVTLVDTKKTFDSQKKFIVFMILIIWFIL